MHFHWFSPLPPARTEIAQYTKRLLPLLQQVCNLTLWTDQKEIDAGIKREYDVRQFRAPDEIDWKALNRADAVFYHIGNNPLFHAGIWRASLLHPGIVVLHDTRLHHFFGDIYLDKEQDVQKYVTQMSRFYGSSGREAAEKFVNSHKSNIDEMSGRYPLTELAYEHALAVVVHTREAFEALRKNNRKPVAFGPLPFSELPARRQQKIEKERGDAQSTVKPYNKFDSVEPVRLIIFGHIGKNRGLHLVLQALNSMPERHHFRLDIYGEVFDKTTAKELIQSSNSQKYIKLHGYVPDQELEQALAKANLAINLRYPTMGEASASQLRIWAHGLPSIVTRVDWYGSLPETVVAHVNPKNTVKDLQNHLRDFLSNPIKWQVMGERAKELLTTEYTSQNYLQTLIEIADAAKKSSSIYLAYKTAERAAIQMSAWAHKQLPESCFRQATYEITTLFGLENED